jgi:hypothetical protein
MAGRYPITKSKCSVLDCPDLAVAKGYCAMHRARIRRHGSSLPRTRPAKSQCSAPNCHELAVAKGYCAMHGARVRRHGSPSSRLRAANGEAQQFMEMAIASETDNCILWPFYVAGNGYPEINVNDRTLRAHRYACQRANGSPANSGLQAAHSCGVRHCVNPRHLRWATQSENEMDRVIHKTSNRGVRQWAHKLIESDVITIRREAAAGDAHDELAFRYGVSRRTVGDIINRKTWCWLPDD